MDNDKTTDKTPATLPVDVLAATTEDSSLSAELARVKGESA